MKLPEPIFSVTPEALDAIDMMCASHELALPVVDSEVLGVSDINQPVVAAPAIRIYDRFGRDTTANNGLQSGFLAVRHDLRVDLAISLQESEDDGLTRRAATALAAYYASTKVRFIHFGFARREW